MGVPSKHLVGRSQGPEGESLRLALTASGDRRTANGVVPVFRATPPG